MDEADLWRRKHEREQRARREAESLLESKALQLWQTNKQLRELAAALEERVEERTRALRETRDRALDAERRAEESSRAKSRFLASISHEIRTPLNAILGYARLLGEKAPSDNESGAWIRHLLRNADHMAALLGNVLDLSRIEADRFEVEQHPLPLLPLLEEVVALVAPRAVERHLSLSLSLQPPLPGQLVSDSIRLQQILVNLLSNAIKFTNEGSVILEVRATPTALTMQVDDTGVGIPADKLDQIWEPFTQGHDNLQRWYGGTGLGLDISRRLAAQLGGEMGVRSTPGKGSSFWVSLPLTELDWQVAMGMRTDSDPDDAPIRLDGISVVVVDDSADNRRLMELVLVRAGAQVSMCHNGVEAVALLTAGSARADVVLMDIQMPVMDGLEATQRLRAAGVSLPIIAITADATARTRRRAREAGCDSHLTKPILPSLLLPRIAACLPSQAVVPATSAPARRQPRDVGLPEELMAEYRTDLRARLGLLEAALADDDPIAFARVNHQVVGSAGSYGYAELSERARAVMTALRACDKQSFADVPLQPLFDEIHAVLA